MLPFPRTKRHWALKILIDRSCFPFIYVFTLGTAENQSLPAVDEVNIDQVAHSQRRTCKLHTLKPQILNLKPSYLETTVKFSTYSLFMTVLLQAGRSRFTTLLFLYTFSRACRMWFSIVLLKNAWKSWSLGAACAALNSWCVTTAWTKDANTGFPTGGRWKRIKKWRTLS